MIKKGCDKLQSLLTCDIYNDYGVKDHRPCALPVHYCRTRKNVSYGKKLLTKFSNRIKTMPLPTMKTNPLPTIKYPDYRTFENDNVQSQQISHLIQRLEYCSRNVHKLLIGYRIIPNRLNRIIPGIYDFNQYEFKITNPVRDRLKHLCNTLGLNKLPCYVKEMYGYTRKGKGIKGIANESYDKVLVEVVTFMNGEYGKLILLVSLGVSCTVWYIFTPGELNVAPIEDLLPNELIYSQFLQHDNYHEQFQKLCFLEDKFITGEVLSALENVFPFSEMDIPVNNNVDVPESSNDRHNLKVAVGLGIMVAVFLTLGIIPTSSGINDEL